MTFVVSEGQVRSLSRLELPGPYRVQINNEYSQDYAHIWRTQPAVRTTVSFLARNIASLKLHMFERLSDTDRKRMTDHPLAQLLGRPNPFTTRYRYFDSLVHDLGIYDVAYGLKLNSADSRPALLRLPPAITTPRGDSWVQPDYFEVQGTNGTRTFTPDQVVHFRGYSVDGVSGTSPIEALRRILAEDYEASSMREQSLRNGARISGYLKRPKEAGQWSPKARRRFSRSWQSQYAGSGPGAGGTPVLEDGMDFVSASWNAQQLQYVETRTLTREEVASAYFIPPTMLGLLDKATFSNIEEQHKMLYQDTLGPWLSMIEEEFELQLAPDFAGTEKTYLEFNLAEKLKGSFEEQAASIQTLTGAPVMSRNEGRGRLNLPAVEGGDDLVVPLNVLVGGQASPTDSGSQNQLAGRSASKGARVVSSKDRAPETYEKKAEQVMAAFFKRQRAVVLTALGAKADPAWWDAARWDKELASDLLALALTVTKQVGPSAAEALGFSADDYDVDRTAHFLHEVAKSRAGAINSTTRDQLAAVLKDDNEDKTPASVFDNAESDRSSKAAATLVTTFSAFATTEAARQLAGDKAQKTWIVTSGNPRPSHAAMDGETVGIDDTFSNGMDWPGDPAGGADEVAGCTCDVEVGVG